MRHRLLSLHCFHVRGRWEGRQATRNELYNRTLTSVDYIRRSSLRYKTSCCVLLRLMQQCASYQRGDPVDAAIAAQTNADFARVYSDLQAINDITQDMNLIVLQQGTHVDGAALQVEMASADVEAARRELGEAYDEKKAARRRNVIICLVCTALLGVLAVVLILTIRNK